MDTLLGIDGSIESSKYKSEASNDPDTTLASKSPFDIGQTITLSSIPLLNRLLCYLLSKVTGIAILEKHYLYLKPGRRKGKAFVNQLISHLGLRSKVRARFSGQPIPHTGGVLLMSNHPYGIADGLLLLQYALTYRDDVKVLVNKAITQVSEFDNLVIPVNPYGGKAAQRENGIAMRECQRWLDEGHCLIVFPAGEVSHYQPSKKSVCDGKWSAHIARLVKKSSARVVPVFFHGHNGWVFHMAGLISPWLRTLMLGRCFINTFGKTIHFTVGEQILPKTYRKSTDINELAKFLRLQSCLLDSKLELDASQNNKPDKNALKLNPSNRLKKNEQEIIAPVDAALLAADVAMLPERSHLLTCGGLSIYFADKLSIPNIMREIGRLREETFRRVGEGTGREIDVDKYDDYYTHLFIWHPKNREVVGSYRAAEVFKVVAEHGMSGLYSHSLFKFSPTLLSQLAPSVELGRSFVRLEYQRSYAPLLMLWKGIAIFLAKETDCSVLFGPVSISNDYSNESQKMLIDYLRVNNPFPQQSKVVKARKPFKLHKRVGWTSSEFRGLKDVDLVSHLVSKLESDQKGVPILLKQYLKLGGYVLSFNVDQDFNDVLDCMIVVDLPQNDHKTLKRYMGEELATDFILRHQSEEVLRAS
ncbi:MAG: lysophospholipid acyltransferase family protein [Gammaproteobacteria bacterium]|nr:lysophospholipid acyltransferase family protein [Gammaproteobacteria bacterium]